MNTDDAYKQLWNLLNSKIPYNPDFGIPTFWRAHINELGSPIKPEMDLDGVPGGKLQAFAKAVVKWTPDGGAEIVPA